jgi:DNA repair protein RadC
LALTIRELNPEDRPREKLFHKGASALTDSELLAILIGSGTKEKSAIEIAQELAAHDGLINKLARYKFVEEFAHVKGIGPAKAAVILAGIELGRRVTCGVPVQKEQLKASDDYARYFAKHLRYEDHEKFYVMLLDTHNGFIDILQVAEGSLSEVSVHPREVYALATKRSRVAKIIIGHNHPSGNPLPSAADKVLTHAIATYGRVIGIPLWDHIIIGDAGYYSFREENQEMSRSDA